MALGVRRRLDNVSDVVDSEIGFSFHRRYSATNSVIIAAGSALEQATLLRFGARAKATVFEIMQPEGLVKGAACEAYASASETHIHEGRSTARDLIQIHPSLTLPVEGKGTGRIIRRDSSRQHLHILLRPGLSYFAPSGHISSWW